MLAHCPQQQVIAHIWSFLKQFSTFQVTSVHRLIAAMKQSLCQMIIAVAGILKEKHKLNKC
jgi:hypothetical protein